MSHDLAPVRGERSTEALDTTDAAEAYADLAKVTGVPLAASVLVAALLIAEAIRESRPV